MLWGCSRSVRMGNLRWEGASWVTAWLVIFRNILPCNLFHETSAFYHSFNGVPSPLYTALAPGWSYEPLANFFPKEDANHFSESKQWWDKLGSADEPPISVEVLAPTVGWHEKGFLSQKTTVWGFLQSSVSGYEIMFSSPPLNFFLLCKDWTIWLADDTFTFVCFQFSYYKSSDLAVFCCMSSSQHLN